MALTERDRSRSEQSDIFERADRTGRSEIQIWQIWHNRQIEQNRLNWQIWQNRKTDRSDRTDRYLWQKWQIPMTEVTDTYDRSDRYLWQKWQIPMTEVTDTYDRSDRYLWQKWQIPMTEVTEQQEVPERSMQSTIDAVTKSGGTEQTLWSRTARCTCYNIGQMADIGHWTLNRLRQYALDRSSATSSAKDRHGTQHPIIFYRLSA